MTDTLDPILLNFFYAALGGLMTLVFMWLGCTLFNRIGIGIGLVIGMGLN